MGCKSSKDGSQPTQKKIGKGGSPEHPDSGARFGSPSKTQMKPIKELSQAELQKHKKVSDILGFVKSGNLTMVHNLIRFHRLGQGVLLLRGLAEDFPGNKVEKVSMAEWNPFLLAVAFKKVDIVRYFTQELKVAARIAGRKPGTSEESVTWEVRVEAELFALGLAIQNKDLAMLQELWTQNYSAWQEEHATGLLTQLVAAKWTQGIQAFFKSQTTEIIFASENARRQIALVQRWLSLRKGAPQDIQKVVDEHLARMPFLLPVIYVALSDTQHEYLTSVEGRPFIEKHHLDFSEVQYGHFKYAVNDIETILVAYEALGAEEAALGAKVREHLKALDEKLATFEYFQNAEFDYPHTLVAQLMAAAQQGDFERLQALLNQYEVRTVPYVPAQNDTCGIQDLTYTSNNFFWTIVHKCIQRREPSEEKIIELVKLLLRSGFNPKQVLTQTDEKGYLNQFSMSNSKAIEQTALIMALDNRLFALFEYLWGEDFVNIWNYRDVTSLFDIIRSQGLNQLYGTLLSSPVATNHFLSLSIQDRNSFVQIYSDAERYEWQKALFFVLAGKYYAPHLLVILAQRDIFMRLTDFALYNEALANTSFSEIEEIAKTNNYDEGFLRFLRYIQMLDASDPKHQEGQKFVDLVYNLDRFQAYKNQSLHIFDNESIVLEEEGLEEGAHKVYTQSAVPNQQQRQVQVKNVRIDDFLNHLQNENEQGAIDFLKTYNLSDLLFFRGSANIQASVYLLAENKKDFVNSYVFHSSLTLLQLAVLYNANNVVNYILSQHKIWNIQTQKQRNVDSRLILVNFSDPEDETLTLRLAIQKNNLDVFGYLWDSFSHLYGDRHLLTVARFIVYQGREDFAVLLLRSFAASQIFQNAHPSQRKEFVDIMAFANLGSTVDQILQEGVYQQVQEVLAEEHLLTLYNLIRDNEIDHLAELLQQYPYYSAGMGAVVFDLFQEDEEVLTLADDSKVTVSVLNPALLALKYKSFACLKLLVGSYGLMRQYMKPIDVVVRHGDHEEYPFRNLIVPILAKVKDLEAVSFLARHDGFVVSAQDLNSFVSMALSDRWLPGLKAFLQSAAAQFAFQALPFEEQRILVERVCKYIADVDDAKTRKSLAIGVVEEVLTKKPFNRHMVSVLIENAERFQAGADLAKLARELLKSLTSEDLMQLANADAETMAEYERRFQNVQGEGFENEIAKIMARYAKDGRLENHAPQGFEQRKQVRFNEEWDNNQIEQQQ